MFYRLAWARAAWRAFGHDRKLATPVVYDAGGSVVAILPLVNVAGTLRFAGWPTTDYNDILVAPNADVAILRTVLATLDEIRPRWRSARLDNLPEHSELLRMVNALAQNERDRMFTIFTAPCSSVVFGENRTEILDDLAGRQSLKRHEKSLQKLGTLSFRHLESKAEAHEHLERFFLQHRDRRAVTEVASRLVHAEHAAFYHALVDEFDPCHELRFSVLELDGEPLAYHFGFADSGKLVWYKPSFSVDWWKQSPGEVLLRQLFGYVRQEQFTEFDFTCGDEGFKTRFANTTRRNFALLLWPGGLRGRLARAGLRTKENLKGRPRLWSLLNRIGQPVQRVTSRLRESLAQDGMLATIGKLVRRCRRMVHVRDEALVFARKRSTEQRPPPDFELGPGKLSDLTPLASTHPDFWHPRKLQGARQRLQSGDKLFIARRADQILHVAWLATREQIACTSEVGPEPVITLPQPVSVIYDCWTPPDHRGQGIYQAVLHALVAHAPASVEETWIWCARSNGASAKAITRAGFILRARLGCRRWFGRRQRTWLEMQ